MTVASASPAKPPVPRPHAHTNTSKLNAFRNTFEVKEPRDVTISDVDDPVQEDRIMRRQNSATQASRRTISDSVNAVLYNLPTTQAATSPTNLQA